MAPLFALLADGVDPTQAGGIAGWTGTGILSVVLLWLLTKYLPGKDAQIKELIAAKDAQAKELIESHAARVTAMIEARDAHVKEIVREHAGQMERLAASHELKYAKLVADTLLTDEQKRKDFRESLQAVLDSNVRETKTWTRTLHHDLEVMGDWITELRRLIEERRQEDDEKGGAA